MAGRTGKCPGCKKKICDGCSLYTGGSFKSSKSEVSYFPSDFAPQPQKGLGIALDLGTTTMAASLWNLKEGRRLAVETCVNPQRFAGSDVVSRIVYSRQSDEQAQKLRSVLIQKLDELAKKLCAEAGGEESAYEGKISENADAGIEGLKEQIKSVTVAGNTAMGEILFGVSLDGLAAAPFQKGYQGCLERKGGELGFSFLENARIILLPAVQGFVGADALSVYTWIKKTDFRKNLLAVDIGTNGEILLIAEEKTYACSAAAGPALEGAAVSQGMGAAPGAIEEVGLLGSFPRQDIYYKTIGDADPAGICGSGLVDALAVLRKLGVLDETGYLRTRQEAAKAGIPAAVCQRLDSVNETNRILLTNVNSPVFLTGNDVRQLQLSKAALRAGIEILLRKAGLTGQDIHCLYLAGAFGSYIKPESALLIGLLPDIPAEKIIAVGNCAGTGAAMALLSGQLRQEMESCSREICHIELAQEAEFEKIFLESIAFKGDI